MEKKKVQITAIIITVILALGLVTWIIMSKINSTTDFSGKKYVFGNEESYISFTSENQYEIKLPNSNSTNGEYKIDNDKITFTNFEKEAYINDNYLLIKDNVNEIYNIYYESSQNDKFLDKLTANLPNYLKELHSNPEELKNLITKFEVSDVSGCFKNSTDDKTIFCAVNYNIYLKDYDQKKCGDYLNYFAGSTPECEANYITKWSYFTFEPEGNSYKVTDSFTGI